MARSIKVHNQSRHHYDVCIGNRISHTEMPGWLGRRYGGRQALLVIDQQVDRHYGELINGLLEPLFERVHRYTVPPGEPSKSVGQWNRLTDFALSIPVRRTTPLVAVGGGVLGDLAGFAAATLLRGLPLVHVPTTLLAMVDSSVGGKTGVNHLRGKNLIGSFYRPDAVFCDLDLLQTLPYRQWLGATGEILKYGALANVTLMDRMQRVLESDDPAGHELLESIVSQCVEIKKDIVEEDETEAGKRAFLNLGHTFAHALEAYSGYEDLLHGEAVYVGLKAACHVSNAYGAQLDLDKLQRFQKIFKLNTTLYENKVTELMGFMYGDKKNINDRLRLVLLKDWHQPVIKEVDDSSIIEKAWRYALAGDGHE